MKKLIILLFFVSFAAQAQRGRVVPGDSIYGNKAKFNNIEYTIVDQPLIDAYDDWFWVDTNATATLGIIRESSVVIDPFVRNGGASTPGGSYNNWNAWWDNYFIPEGSPFRFAGEFIYEFSEFTGLSNHFWVVPRTRPEGRSSLSLLSDGQTIEIWRLGYGSLIFPHPNE